MREERAANPKGPLEERARRQIHCPAQIPRRTARKPNGTRFGMVSIMTNCGGRISSNSGALNTSRYSGLCGPPIWMFANVSALNDIMPPERSGTDAAPSPATSRISSSEAKNARGNLRAPACTPELLHFVVRRRDQDSEKFELAAITSLDRSECRRQFVRWLIAEKESNAPSVLLREENGVESECYRLDDVA